MKLFLLILGASLSLTSSFAQKRNIDLSHIWTDYLFYPKFVPGFNFMNDGVHYSQLDEANGKAEITEYSLAKGEKTRTIATLDVEPSDYAFSADEQKIVLETQVERIYRHSSQANFLIYDCKTKQTTPVSDKGKQRYATFNPAGDKIAFVRDNNLFYKDLKTNKEIQITKDGKYNSIINGASDWVYEEEFAIARTFEWSPDGSKIGFLRMDESAVKEFRLTYFTNELYPSETTFKYPKAGETNSVVTAHVYDLASKKINKVDTKGTPDQYLPRIHWTLDNELCITRLNRYQNELTLLLYNPKSNQVRELLSEKNKAFIDITNNLTFLKSKQFIWSSDEDGWHHLYLYDMNGKKVKQLTQGNFDVTNFYGVDEAKGLVYYQAAANLGKERALFSVALADGKTQELSKEKGNNDAQFSSNYQYYVLNHSSVSAPPSFAVYETAKNTVVRVLEDNSSLKKIMADFNWGKHEFFTFKTKDNVELNGYMILPPNFDESKKYPVFMMAYGGPGRQTVLNEWGGFDFAWFNMLAQQGYIVVSVDNRGTDARGEAFRKSTYLQLGKYECLDQIEAAQYLGTLKYVDASRIGIFGWSFGGYLSSLCLAKGAGIFKMAIAVAPVTNWKWYDTIYTERYMRTPKENKEGYDGNSPINFAGNIKGKYLLVHGTGDDNVHAQNAFEMVRVLVENNIPFDQAFYTNKAHGISGGKTRYHLYNKMTNFIKESL